MTEDMVMALGAETIQIILYLAGPMLGAAMVVGIIVSIFQAVTQINEATLTFIPKMVAVIVVLVVLAPWMLEVLQNYTSSVIGQSGDWVRLVFNSPRSSA